MTNRRTNSIITGLELATSVLAFAVIARMVLGPDAIVQLRMRVLRAASNTAKLQADMWTTIAARADTAYHRTYL